MLRTTEANWSNFSNSLSNIFASQYGKQSAIYNTLTNTLTNQLTNPHGFDPATLSALRGGMTDNISNQFNSARQNVQAGMAANGSFGSDVKSGIDAQIKGQIAGQQASTEASGLDSIEQQDAALKQQNYWSAVQGLGSVAQGLDPNGIAKNASIAAGETGQLGSEFFGTDNNGMLDKLGSGFSSGLGSSLGSFAGSSATKGVSSLGKILGGG